MGPEKEAGGPVRTMAIMIEQSIGRLMLHEHEQQAVLVP